MRFHHEDIISLTKYILASQLNIIRVDNQGRNTSQLSKLQLKKYLLPEIYMGEVWTDYILLCEKVPVSYVGLIDAVEKIEAGNLGDCFLLASYYDDDVVSISNEQLVFQTNCSRADWWEPII